MINFIVNYGVSIGIVIISFVIIIFSYLNNKKTTKIFKKLNAFDEKILKPLEFPERLLNIAKGIVALVLLFCGSQATATIEDVRTSQKTISKTISKINSNIEENDNHLHKCMQDETEKIINKLDSLLRTEEPNNVK